MPTRNINLTAKQDALVAKLVKSGEYQNASEAIRDALRALEQRREEDALRLEVLRHQVELGVEALAAGRFVELEGDSLEAGLLTMADQPVRRSRRR